MRRVNELKEGANQLKRSLNHNLDKYSMFLNKYVLPDFLNKDAEYLGGLIRTESNDTLQKRVNDKEISDLKNGLEYVAMATDAIADPLNVALPAGMVKKANGAYSLGKSALGGAGIGAGIGFVQSAPRADYSDEQKLMHAAGGAVFGGALNSIFAGGANFLARKAMQKAQPVSEVTQEVTPTPQTLNEAQPTQSDLAQGFNSLLDSTLYKPRAVGEPISETSALTPNTPPPQTQSLKGEAEAIHTPSNQTPPTLPKDEMLGLMRTQAQAKAQPTPNLPAIPSKNYLDELVRNLKAQDLRKELRAQVGNELNAMRGKVLKNKEGLEAIINAKSIKKMLSDKAIEKSVANGFTQEQHFKAVQNLENLFGDAKVAFKTTDEADGNLNIYRLNAPFIDENANALLTLKEYMENGKRFYSLELEKLEALRFNPSGKAPSADTLKSKDFGTTTSEAPIKAPSLNSSANSTPPQVKTNLNTQDIIQQTAQSLGYKEKPLSTKITSKLSQDELDKMPVATQQEYEAFLDNIKKGNYKDTPELLKIGELNEALSQIIPHKSKNIFISRSVGEHTRAERKGKYNQDLSDNEARKIPYILSKATDAYIDKNPNERTNGFMIPFESEKAGRVNMVFLGYDNKGNFVITTKNAENRAMGLYDSIAERSRTANLAPTEAGAPSTMLRASSDTSAEVTANPRKVSADETAMTNVVNAKPKILTSGTRNNSSAPMSLNSSANSTPPQVKTNLNTQEAQPTPKTQAQEPTQPQKVERKDLNKSLQRAYDSFKAGNKDKYNDALFERVIKVANDLGVTFKYHPMKRYAGIYKPRENEIRIQERSNKEQESEFLLHELIHSATSRAILCYEKGKRDLLTKPQIEGIEELQAIYRSVRRDKKHYGFKNTHEFLAELSNPAFRAVLKAQNVLVKVVKAIRKIITNEKRLSDFEPKDKRGFKPKEALSETEKALYKIIDNYSDPKLFSEKYTARLNVKLNKESPHNFGENFKEFKGDVKGAVKKLAQEKRGAVEGVYTYKGLGEITLPYGEYNPATKKGFGLAKIIEKHGGDFEQFKGADVETRIGNALEIMLQKGKQLKDEPNNIYYVENGNYYKLALKDEWLDEKTDKWVMTAFNKGNLTDEQKKAIDSLFGVFYTSFKKFNEPMIPSPTINMHNSTLTQLKNSFKTLNKDKENGAIFEKAISVADQLGVKVEFKAKANAYNAQTNTISLADENPANMLHELIHAVTSRAISNKDKLNQTQKQAISEIEKIYNHIEKNALNLGFKRWDNVKKRGDYGLSNIHEFLAELSNKTFRNKLKKVGVFGRIVDNILHFFGFKKGKDTTETNAYEATKSALMRLLDSCDFDRQLSANGVHNKLSQKATIAQKQEQDDILAVLEGSKNKAVILRDLENVEKALAVLTKGNKNKGAKHIELRHSLDESQGGYVTRDEILDIGNKMRQFIKHFGEPLTEKSKNGRVALIYEWQNKDGVRFRLVTNNKEQLGGGAVAHAHRADSEIITFYSDRNLNAMDFKNKDFNPQVLYKQESRVSLNDKLNTAIDNALSKVAQPFKSAFESISKSNAYNAVFNKALGASVYKNKEYMQIREQVREDMSKALKASIGNKAPTTAVRMRNAFSFIAKKNYNFLF